MPGGLQRLPHAFEEMAWLIRRESGRRFLRALAQLTRDALQLVPVGRGDGVGSLAG